MGSNGASLDERVQQIVQHAYDNTPALKARMDGAGVTPAEVEGVDELAKIPTISKDEMVAMQAENPPFGGMLAVPPADLKWVFFSPGPLYEGVSDDETAVADSAATLEAIGFTAGDVVLNAMSYHLVPFGILFDSAVRRMGGTVLPTGVGNTELQVKMMLDFRASAYIGTPSFLAALIEKAEEFGVDFATQGPLKKAMVTAEPLPPSLRERFNGLGIAVTNVYGTAELGLLGYEPDGQQGFTMPDDKVIQICDPETGEPLPDGEVGEIVATNFNRAYPIIRMGTGDLSMLSGDPPRLMGWMGRTGDAVKVRGMFLHPNQLQQVMGQFDAVAGYQAVVTRPENRDMFTLRVVLADAGVDQDALREAINEAVPPVCRVRPDEVAFVGGLDEDAPPIVDERTWE